MAKYYDQRDDVGVGIIIAGLSQDNIFYAAFIIAELTGIILVILTAYCFHNYFGGFSFQTPSQAFNYHPVFMMIGMVFLNANGILIYRVTRSLKLRPQKLIHATIQIGSIITSSFGVYCAFYSHDYASPPIPNLYSLHSWLGMFTFVSFILTWPLAFITFLWPGLSPVMRRFVLPFHLYFGNFFFALSSAVVISGLTEKAIFSTTYKLLPPAAKFMNVIGLLVVAFTTIVLWLLTKPEFKRRYIPGVNEAQYPMRREASID